LQIAVTSMRSAGLQDFVIDLGHARIVGALIENLSAERAKPLVDALQAKDDTLVAKLASESGLPKADAAALAALPELHGAHDVWSRAEKQLGKTSAGPALAELRVIWDALHEAALAPKLLVDFSETRNFAYYTGMMFHIHAAGPGLPIGSGGRYDGLLDNFGLARPAAGFAVTLDSLAWARREAGCEEAEPLRLLIVGNSAGLAAALRAQGVSCAEGPERDSLAYARAWRYTHVLEVLPGQSVLTRLRDNQQQTIIPEPLVIRRSMGAE
jgi:ATP phosphoribosyltransferase regulatory subunit